MIPWYVYIARITMTFDTIMSYEYMRYESMTKDRVAPFIGDG